MHKSLIFSTSAENITCSIDTFNAYVAALEKLFVIQDMDAWCPAIRSKSVIRSTPKRCFCDPSIAVAALQLSPSSFRIAAQDIWLYF